MLINPTIHFLADRAKVLARTLLDPLHLLSGRQLVALQQEYDNIAAAMRAIKHPDLHPAAATYPANLGTLWAWWCHESRQHESHTALSLVTTANARCRDGAEAWSDALNAANFNNVERNIES